MSDILDPATLAQRMTELPDWQRGDDDRFIRRRFEFKGFLRAQQMANLAGWLGDHEGHHPDIRFGYGYCEVRFTTHDAGGLTERDLTLAAKLDGLVG